MLVLPNLSVAYSLNLNCWPKKQKEKQVNLALPGLFVKCFNDSLATGGILFMLLSIPLQLNPHYATLDLSSKDCAECFFLNNSLYLWLYFYMVWSCFYNGRSTTWSGTVDILFCKVQRTLNSSLLGKTKFIKFAYTFVHHLANKSTLLLNIEGTGVKLVHSNATLKDLASFNDD